MKIIIGLVKYWLVKIILNKFNISASTINFKILVVHMQEPHMQIKTALETQINQNKNI